MADNSLVTKTHLRQSAENTVEKLNDLSTAIGTTVATHDTNTEAHADIRTVMAAKVDKVSGKGLSTNDYTTAEKNKLAGIAAGAEVNVNADWNATSGDAQILNKPTLGSLAAKSTVVKSDLASDVQTSLGKADTALQSFTETDPTVPAWAKEASKPTYTASEVGADASGTASGLVSSHNTSTSAHNDIRDLINGLTTRLNALADSDDTTLDQMSEVVAYIKNNKTLIEQVTTNKVNVADIINNLTTNVSNKPLSAAQGVVLKALIDGLEKADVGLSNVDNTSDANKPVSTAQATAIADAKKAGTDAQAQLTAHNTATDAHADIRQAIEDAMYTHPSYTAKSSGLYKITVDATGHVSAVTAVTKADITALGIPGQDTDTVYTHPSYTAKSSGLYKITVDATGHVSAVTAVTKADITALGIPAQDTTYTHPSHTALTGVPITNQTPGFGETFSVSQPVTDAQGHVTAINNRTVTVPNTAATTSAPGLMSAADKSKLDGIEAGATSGGSVPIATASSSDGITYTATVNNIGSLSVGQLIVFLSTKTSASTAPTLNINGLGAKTIKRRLSNLSSTTTSGASNNWLYANKPQLMMYDGTYWIVVNQDKPVASDLYGSLPGTSTSVTFLTSDWAAGSDGTYTMAVPASTHGRTSNIFGTSLMHLVDGVYKTNTFACIETSAYQDSSTSNIILTSSDAYDGAVVFY